jgi:hypothetical protein
MYYNPHTHMEIARARHDDLLRSAEKHRLAKLVVEKRPGPIARLQAFFGHRHTVAKHEPVVHPA